jgi:pyruvate dehydrogenase E1 component
VGFVGDGEMDEPEALAGLSLAAREKLDNLVLVVNCNLQRLDWPVRGNGSIVQELEGLFAARVERDQAAVERRLGSALRARHAPVAREALPRDGGRRIPDVRGDHGGYNREHFFNKYPELRELVAHLSDDDIDRLRRGGHDPVKIFSAYWHAARHAASPR